MIGRERRAKIAALLLNIAHAEFCPDKVFVVGARLCRRDHAGVSGLRRIELAGLLLKPAILKHPIDIRRIKPGGPRIIVPRSAGVGHGGDRGQVSIRRRRILGVLVGALLLVLGDRLQQRLRFVRLAGFEKLERLRVAGIGCGAFRDGGDRLGQALLGARNRRLRRRDETVFVDQRGDFRQRLFLLIRLPVEPASDDRQRDDHRCDRRAQPPLLPPLPLGAAVHVVGGEAGEAGDGLGEAEVLAVGALAQIGAKDSDGAVGDGAVGGEFVAQRRRKIIRPVPSMMTGITGRSGWRDRNSRTSSLTAGRPAETVEHSTMRAADASSAVTVASVSVWPPEKSSRSRKIGRRVFGTGPTGVCRPIRSLSMRKPSSRACSHLAQAMSRWL